MLSLEDFLRFMDLSDDCILAIFKFLDFKGRVKLERICSRFATLLDRLWLSQKALVFFEDWDPCLVEKPFWCKIRDHSFDDMFDSMFLRSLGVYSTEMDAILEKLVKKCYNLRALYWFPVHMVLKSEWLSNCSRLEHIHLRTDFSSSTALCDFVEKMKDKSQLKCVNMVLDQESVEQLAKCLGLKSLTIRVSGFTQTPEWGFTSFSRRCPQVTDISFVQTLAPVLPSLRQLDIGERALTFVDKDFLKHLLEYALHLDTFSFYAFTDMRKDFLDGMDTLQDEAGVGQLGQKACALLKKKLPKLRSLGMRSSNGNFNSFLGAFENIESITWYNRMCGSLHMSPTLLELCKLHLKDVNLNLKSLELAGNMSADDLMAISRLYPNLVTLKLKAVTNLVSLLKEMVLPYRCLQYLRLQIARVNEATVVRLLDQSPHLREAIINWLEGDPINIFNRYLTYAQLHSKRAIRLYLHLSSLDWRQVRVLRGPGNLRIYCYGALYCNGLNQYCQGHSEPRTFGPNQLMEPLLAKLEKLKQETK